MSFKSRAPQKIVDYFGTDQWLTLRESFVPGRGWRLEAPNLSLTRIHQLRAQGATRIAVACRVDVNDCNPRIADFGLDELS